MARDDVMIADATRANGAQSAIIARHSAKDTG
jgi:hypothetical protein